MCLMVYLGLDAPLDGYGDVPVDEVGLELCTDANPFALADRAVVYRVADRIPNGWNCSCVFNFVDLGLEDDEAEQIAVHAYARLCEIVKRAVGDGLNPAILGAWDGEQGKKPTVQWRLAPEHLVPGLSIFSGFGLPVSSTPCLVTIDPAFEEPVRHVP